MTLSSIADGWDGSVKIGNIRISRKVEMISSRPGRCKGRRSGSARTPGRSGGDPLGKRGGDAVLASQEGDQLGGQLARIVHARDLVLPAELAARPHPVVEPPGAATTTAGIDRPPPGARNHR